MKAGPVTRDFSELVISRIQRSQIFRQRMLCETVECLLSGDFDTGKAVLRDYIKATCGFPALSEGTGIAEKSLIRMFGPAGNPQAKNLLRVVAWLQLAERIRLTVRPARAA